MKPGSRSFAALVAIADTFAAGSEPEIPSASRLGVPEVVAELVGGNRRKAEQLQFRLLLELWDLPGLHALFKGGLSRFSALPPGRREEVLLSWAESRVPACRAAFHGLRQTTLLAYYSTNGPGGGPNPLWREIDYPGPLGPLPEAPVAPLQVQRLESDAERTIDCDVVVIGSGAGGGTAAGVLAGAGLDVVVLEAGEYYDDRDFDGGELDGIRRLYDSSPAATDDGAVALSAGSCLGGGTVVNYSTSFRTPDSIRAGWARAGVPAFETAEYGAALDAVCKRLGVNTEHDTAAARDAKLEAGCRELGWHVDAMARNVLGCDQGVECGRCCFGCRIGAKQSTAKTWLADAAEAGARIYTNARARRVLHESGVATGVEATAADGSGRLTVRSRAVVSACGSLHGPALLKRSGLTNPHIGQHLHLHPVTVIFGVYPDEVRPWEGGMQTRYSTELGDLDGNGHGVLFETGPSNPHLPVGFMPWRGSDAHAALMRDLSRTVPLGSILHDTSEGQVKIGRDGEPIVSYSLNELDRGHVHAGIEGAAKIHAAAGAERVYSSHARWCAYEPARGERDLARFLGDCESAGYGPGECPLGALHIMGSSRMGGSPSSSACGPEGETWEVRNLIVADASCFPSSSGVNPMISVEAIAYMNAKRLAERLTG